MERGPHPKLADARGAVCDDSTVLSIRHTSAVRIQSPAFRSSFGKGGFPLCRKGALCDAKLNRTVVEWAIQQCLTICRDRARRFVLFLSEYFIPLLVTHIIDHSTISRVKIRYAAEVWSDWAALKLGREHCRVAAGLAG